MDRLELPSQSTERIIGDCLMYQEESRSHVQFNRDQTIPAGTCKAKMVLECLRRVVIKDVYPL